MGFTLSWDAEDRIKSVSYNETRRIEYDYDGQGRRVRIRSIAGGIKTAEYLYLWAGLSLWRGRRSVQHGFKRARWRGLWRQSIQDYLIAAIQNLRIIARRQKNLLFVLGRKLLGAALNQIIELHPSCSCERSIVFLRHTIHLRLLPIYRPFGQQPVVY